MAVERQATGCPACNADIAYALERMRDLPGYLSADAYAHRYHNTPMPWLKPHVDGTFIPATVSLVEGEDGWLIANNRAPIDDPRIPLNSANRAHLCDCGSDHVQCDLYRGSVVLQ